MKHAHNESDFVRHLPCEYCGSSDNRALFSDGHTFCYSCPEEDAWQAGEGGAGEAPARRRERMADFAQGEVKALLSRKITAETCKVFGYLVGEDKRGKPVQIAPYYDAEGNLVAQKLRYANKDFKVVGDIKNALPFGAHRWPKKGKMVVVTEGEVDALAMSQVQDNKWPVVSIASGAGNQTRKYIARLRDYFMGFDKVVLMFDMDEPGRQAAEAAAEVLGSRAHIAELPEGFKDASDMLMAGKSRELINAMWSAKPYRPEGIVELSTLKEAAKGQPTMGLSWPWPGLTELTFGIQQPYVYAIGAGTGTGKTEVLRQLMTHMVREHGVKIAGFLFEEEPHVTAKGMASVIAKRQLHTPEGYDEAAFDVAWAELISQAPVYLYDSFGMIDWETVEAKIEYLYHAEGVRYFFIDHLTAFAAGADDERRELEKLMAEVSGLATKHGITIFIVSHLTTPMGTPHEEGGRVMVRHFKGSRAIGYWSFGIIGLERDQQAEDITVRHTTTVRVLKLRGFGWNVGKCSYLKYDPATGLLEETGPPEAASGHGFVDESLPTADLPWEGEERFPKENTDF